MDFADAPTLNKTLKESVDNNEEIEMNSDEELDEESYEQNDYPPNDVPDELIDHVKNMKYSLYENIVLSPKLGTKKAQDPELLNVYLSNLNKIYRLAIDASNNNRVVQNDLMTFPINTREIIQTTLEWIYTFFKKNQIPDTIPVADYIERNLKENQFIQYGGLITDE